MHWANVDVPGTAAILTEPLNSIKSQLELVWIVPSVIQVKVGRETTNPHDLVESAIANGLTDEEKVKKVQVVPEKVK